MQRAHLQSNNKPQLPAVYPLTAMSTDLFHWLTVSQTTDFALFYLYFGVLLTNRVCQFVDLSFSESQTTLDVRLESTHVLHTFVIITLTSVVRTLTSVITTLTSIIPLTSVPISTCLSSKVDVGSLTFGITAVSFSGVQGDGGCRVDSLPCYYNRLPSSSRFLALGDLQL